MFTIDSKNTRFRDDGISITKDKDNFLVQIHIADVAEYIKFDSSLNKAIQERDQTIYIKNYHQPMIP